MFQNDHPFGELFFWKFPTFLATDQKYIYNSIAVNLYFR